MDFWGPLSPTPFLHCPLKYEHIYGANISHTKTVLKYNFRQPMITLSHKSKKNAEECAKCLIFILNCMIKLD